MLCRRAECEGGAAPAPVVSQTRSRAALEVPPGALRRPGLVPYLSGSPAAKADGTESKRGAKVRQDAAVERRKAQPVSPETGPRARRSTGPVGAYGAPLPL